MVHSRRSIGLGCLEDMAFNVARFKHVTSYVFVISLLAMDGHIIGTSTCYAFLDTKP